MNDPLVSFIIPTFNRPAFLAAALESIFTQDYPAKEIIVVDDGSTGGTTETCARFPVLYLHQENRGPSAARNLGATRCGGDLLVFLDDDDLCPPGSLQARVEQWRRDPGWHHVVGRVRRFQEDQPGHIEFIDSPEQAANIICSGAEVMMRTAFEQVGGYDEALRMSEDDDLWMRMREAGLRQKFIPETCLFNRRHPGNATAVERNVEQKSFVKALHLKIQRGKQQQQHPASPL